MAMKLEQISRQYHSFVDDQVLTSGHLNALVDYFEDQDRLSRILLTGTGIVCGLKLEKVSGDAIVMSQGVSITTDGDILYLEQTHDGKNFGSLTITSFSFKYVREFEDLNAEYTHFKNADGKTFPLYELLLTDGEGAEPLSQLLQGGGDFCLVLYLESYPQKSDLCTTESCDNQGVKQVNRIRVLLLRRQDVEEIAKKDTLFTAFDVEEMMADMPMLQMPRIVLNPTNTADVASLKKAYLTNFSTANGVVADLKSALKLLAKWSSVLQLDENIWNRISNTLDEISTNVADQGFQYHYDVLCDIVDTWNEIRALLPKVAGFCMPDPRSFPKHILIGNLKLPKILRHRFYKSSALANGDESLAYLKNLLGRLLVLTESFHIQSGNIKITPSLLHASIDKKAIPFYYKPIDELIKTWSFEKANRSEERSHLGYFSDQWAIWPQIKEPLKYRLSPSDFFRIEGHQGKNYVTALDEIVTMADTFGLPFDVKAIALEENETDIDIGDYACEFADLDLLLKVWTEEQDCILAEVTQLFTGFDTAEPGKNDMTKRTPATEMKMVEEIEGPVKTRVLADTRRTASSSKVLLDTKVSSTVGIMQARKDVVANSVVSKATTVGKYIEATRVNTKDLPASVAAGIYKQEAEKNLDAAVWKGKEELKQLTIDLPLEIYAHVEKVAAALPGRVEEINQVNTDRYLTNVDDLCRLVKNLKVSYQAAMNSGLSPEVQAVVALMINQLSGICCSGSKLKTLQAEIEKRKQHILSRLTLSQFVREHPGLDHAAGVTPGGTFVMVYVNKQSKISRSLNRLARGQQRIEKTLTTIPAQTVVADFYLPYRCCSDCAPVNFIVQQTPVSPELEDDGNCIDDTIAAIHQDLESLQNIDTSYSKLLSPAWKATAEMYGGTPDFANGILDKPAFLDGGLDDQLAGFFWSRLQSTFRNVVELSSDKQNKDLIIFMQLLELQLRLLYHVLQCQKDNVVNKYAEHINSLLDEIIAMYAQLSEKGVSFSPDFVVFMKRWSAKVKNVVLLRKHGDQVLSFISK